MVWGTSIVCLSIAWNQFEFQPGLQPGALLVALVLFAVGVPLVFGALAGCLIRRNGPWREILVMAAIGAACIALTVYVQWVGDPRACVQSPDSPCDISLGVSMVLVFAVCFGPFLVGAVAGRVVVTRRIPRVVPTEAAREASAGTPMMPIGIQGWRWFSGTVRSAPSGLKVVVAAAFLWAACVYLFVGPLVFDEAYWLLGKAARVRPHRRWHVGLSVAVAVGYVVLLAVPGMTMRG